MSGMAALSFVEDSFLALERAVHDRDDDLRNVQLATASPAGRPALRTLVLRGFDRSAARAEMHSDARAGKVHDIAHCRQVSLLAWSAKARLQLRFTGIAELHRDDAVARSRWDKLSPAARQAYGLLAAPGSPISDPAAQHHMGPGSQFEQFVVILVSLAEIDVLHLGAEGGQTRASGYFSATGVTAGWIGA